MLYYMQEKYSLFPKRRKAEMPFQNLPTLQFFTNFYEVNLEVNHDKIYQYEVELPQYIPTDSPIYKKSVNFLKPQLLQDIGYITNKGIHVWGKKKEEKVLVYKFPFSANLNKIEKEKNPEEKPHGFEEKHSEDFSQYLEVYIKKTEEFTLKDMEIKQRTPELLQILNIMLKQSLSEQHMAELGRSGKYFSTTGDNVVDLNSELQIAKGFKFTLISLNGLIRFQVNICSRLLQRRNLLEFLLQSKKSKDEQRSYYEGQFIITTYGKMRTYCITEIDYDKTPESLFFNDKLGKQISYLEYYKDVYGVKIYHKKQPLIRIEKNVRKFIDGKVQLEKETIYLIPELVKLAGLTKQQKKTQSIMRRLANLTNYKPFQRVQQCNEFIQLLNRQQNSIKIGNIINTEGYTLDLPYKRFLKTKVIIKALFAFRVSRNRQEDLQAKNIQNLLSRAGKKFDISFRFSNLSIKRSDAQDWADDIYYKLQEKERYDIIIAMVSENEDYLYGPLKKIFTEEFKILSQFVRKKTVANDRTSFSVASKIAEQISVKVGKIPWKIQMKNEYLRNHSFMYGGISLSKPVKEWVLSFVGTTSQDLTQTYSEFRTEIRKKQYIPQDQLQKILVNWGNKYLQKNKKQLPENIIIYREGLTQSQTQEQITIAEIPAIKAMCEMMREKAGVKKYSPEILIVLANRHINCRIYDRKDVQSDMINPPEGTVVIDGRDNGKSYDFYLVSQKTTLGTATPTLFRIAYGNEKIPVQALIEFTYNQCYCYYNWSGSIRVPACLQNANKLSKLVGEGNLEQGFDEELREHYYYL